MQNADRPRILYIAGWGRSGSTILANILGQLPGVVSVGEIRDIWKHGFIENRKCGCGVPFLECDMWRETIARAFGGPENVDAARWSRLSRIHTRTLGAAAWLARGGRPPRHDPTLREYVDVVGKLYLAISQVTCSKVIVDSSKVPLYGGVLRLVDGTDLHLLHLVRDPRAVAYSWSRRKGDSGAYAAEATPVIGLHRSSVLWLTWNFLIERLGAFDREQYSLIRYEDFAAEPKRVIGSLLGVLGQRGVRLPFVGASTAKLGTTHTVSGNPGRFEVGRVNIHADTRWLAEMSVASKLAVSLLTSPLLRRYGYGFL